MTRVTHLTWLLSNAGGGIPPVVAALGSSQRILGVDASALGVEDPNGSVIETSGFPTAVFRSLGPVALGVAPGIERELRRQAPDILHLHGLFTWQSRQAFAWGRQTGRPVVVSPHGMLDPWALANSRIKKRVFRWLVEDANLHGAACLHALTPDEAKAIRALGLRGPIAVFPNGVGLPDPGESAGEVPWHGLSNLSGRRVILFLGRIHPKKGLTMLVEAWANVMTMVGRRAGSDWMLVIAGPDQGGHRRKVEELVEARSIGDSVAFLGPLYGERKWAALRAARAFVLPSLSEGFPMAVLEAMAVGLPAIVSTRCNMDLAREGIGLVCDPTVDGVAKALVSFMRMKDVDVDTWGARARETARTVYSWRRVALLSTELYAWLLGRAPCPAFVEA